VGDFRLGEHVFVTTPGRDVLAELRKAYLTRAAAICAAARDEFDSLATPAVVFGRQPIVLDRAFDQTVAAAAQDIAQDRIYHLDAAALRRNLEARTKALREGYDRIRERYHAIIDSGQEREALRAAEAGNSPSIIGGGFGVEGAAKGMAIAAAANAAIGVVHGAANAVAKAAATAGDQQKREQLFRAPETQQTLMALLHGVILEGHIVVAEIVNRERAEPKFDIISIEARGRAVAFTENVEAGRVPESDIAPVLIEALQLDPFREKPWRLWLEHLGDADGGLARAAEALGVTVVATHKSGLLDRQRAALAWSTPEECQANVEILHETAQFLGLPFDKERREIEVRAKRLDRERRTFMGAVYNTMEEANEARLAAEDLARRTVDGVVHESQSAADAFRRARAAEQAAELARKRRYRSTSFFLWLAVLIAPLPAGLLTLAPGFRPWQRIAALLWMALVVVLLHSALVPLAILGAIVTGLALALMRLEISARKRLWRPARRAVQG
jgi:hypothetical protein